MVLLIISFIAGILTVLAPCVLPVLPIIIGGSVADGVNKKKTFTIITSLALSILLFTFVLKASTLFIDIPEYTWKLVSGGIILILGIVTVFPLLWENKFIAKMSIKSNKMLGKGDSKKSFWGDVIVGMSLGPVFSTCSPTYFLVLATVLPVSPVLGLVYLIAYVVGLSLSLLAIVFIGSKIMKSLNIASNPDGWFKKVFGVIFIIVGIAILSGLDKKLETKITSSTKFFDITKIEQRLLSSKDEKSSSVNVSGDYLTMAEKEAKYKRFTELVSPDGYINTDGKKITLADLKGKVVLLDIWTYSCINCQRTIPYINQWYDKYKDQGFEVVGIHTPEFAFEKVQVNVEKAVDGFKIKYPVILDNEYQTWNALGNQYWPRKYIIDSDGFVIYDHIGEGDYEKTEKVIQYALKERADKLGISADVSTTTVQISSENTQGNVDSPETYFGSARNQYLGNGNAGVAGVQNLSLPKTISKNKLYLEGSWNLTSEQAENVGPASIVYKYDAKTIYMTAGSDTGVEVEIYKDDVFVKKILIKDETLYTLIEGNDYGKHILKIKIPKKGLKAFTFTFG